MEPHAVATRSFNRVPNGPREHGSAAFLRAAKIVPSFNGKPKATAWQPGANAVAFGLPLNDPNSTERG